MNNQSFYKLLKLAVFFFFLLFSAAQFIKQKLPDLLRSYVDADLGGNQEGGFQDIAIEVLHLLLSHLLFGQKGASGVGQEQIDAFLKTLCRGMGAIFHTTIWVRVETCEYLQLNRLNLYSTCIHSDTSHPF